MVSQVGQDAFGTHLVGTLKDNGVDTRWVFRTDRASTGLSFVSLDASGNRTFSFFRNPAADLLLDEAQIVPEMFSECAALHFCSVDLVDWPVRRAHRRAIELARQRGALISFDPNVRLPLWDDPESCQATIREFLPFADVVKLSDDELLLATGCTDEREAARWLFSLGCRLLVVTRGARGASAYTPGAVATVRAPEVAVRDTTGAGDSFIGAFLFQLVRDGVACEELGCLDAGQLERYLEFSAKYASLTVQRQGASMASAAELADVYPELAR